MIEIVSRYKSGESTKTLAGELGISTPTLLKKMRSLGIEIEKRKGFKTNENLDTTFFSKIDKESKAYALGLMYSDGSVSPYFSKTGGVCSYKLRIRLQESDRDILQKISYELCGDDITTIIVRDIKNWSNIASLQIGNIQLGKDLIALGCPPNKSSIITLPSFSQVPEHLYRHFIRGFFDGDGGCTSKPPITSTFTSNKKMCDQIQSYLRDTHNIYFKDYRERKNGYGSIVISGRDNCYGLYHFLYNDSSFYIKRKRDKLINVIQMSKGANQNTDKIKTLKEKYPVIV